MSLLDNLHEGEGHAKAALYILYNDIVNCTLIGWGKKCLQAAIEALVCTSPSSLLMVLALGSPCQTASSLLPGQHQPEISHPCIHPHEQISLLLFFFLSLSLSLSKPYEEGVLVLMGPSFLMPTTEITSHLHTLFPTRENSLAPPSTGTPHLCLLHRRHTLLPPPDGVSSQTRGSPRMLCTDQ